MMPNKKPIHIYSLQISKEWFYQNTRRKCAVNIQRSDSDVIRWKVISMRSTQYPELHSVRCRYIAASQEIVHSHVTVQFNPAAVTSALPVLSSACIITLISLLSDISCVQLNTHPLSTSGCQILFTDFKTVFRNLSEHGLF